MRQAIMSDTHRYIKKAQDVGFTEQQAEFQADEFKNLINEQMITKSDVNDIKNDIKELRKEITGVRDGLGKEINMLRSEVGKEITAFRSEVGKEITALRNEVGKEITTLRSELGKEINAVKDELRKEMSVNKNETSTQFHALRKDMDDLAEKITYQLTIRFSSMSIVGFTALGILLKLGR